MFEMMTQEINEFSKKEIEDSVEKLLNLAMNGSEDIIEMFLHLKRINEITTEILKNSVFNRILTDKLDFVNNGDREFMGVNISLRKGIDKWDFTSDPEWSGINSTINLLKEELKEIEKSLKSNYKIGRSSILNTGEISDSEEISVKYGRPIVSVKFK